jgi:GNAT superfamily N-acetyltransferase
MERPLTIRRAVSRDADAIAKLAAQAAGEEGAASSLEADRIKAHAFGSNALFEAWVAQERQQRRSLRTRSSPRATTCAAPRPTSCCANFTSYPNIAAGGLARKMMSAVARRARDWGARELAITTGVENEVAQRFFNAVGAKKREAAVFMMSADGIEWLAAEGN